MPLQNEAARLGTLRNLRLLDTMPSESFDRITRLVSNVFGLPVAAISLTDTDRQWFKSKVGIDHCEIPRERAPCAEVAEKKQPLVIQDFQQDPFYSESHLGRAGVRFYAGVPLVTPDGYGLGALCVLSLEPRQVSQHELDTLSDLAAMVMDQIELQHAAGRIEVSSGLPNRYQLMTDLIDLTKREESGYLTINLLDLAQTSEFERLSRVLAPGHLDATIKDVAHLLNAHVGVDGHTYHIAPTQFAFFTSSCGDTDNHRKTMEALLSQVEQCREFPSTITPSIGFMDIDPRLIQPDDIIRSLQGAVQDGRANATRIGCFSTSLDERHRRSYAILRDFQSALACDDQLRLVFQPRRQMASGNVKFAEALLRWHHPLMGSISPAEFIPIIEASALARELTAWVIDKSLQTISAWKKTGHEVGLSINISASNLQEADFVERLAERLAHYGVSASEIELELTETAIMKEADQALDVLQQIRGLGIRLALDDFGTGYSSLAYLQKLPIDTLKIDRSFVADMVNGNRERVLVRSMIDLSHSLGYKVVAEGVELAEMSDLLDAMRCDEIQGYWLSAPLSGDNFLSWVANQNSAGLKLTA